MALAQGHAPSGGPRRGTCPYCGKELETRELRIGCRTVLVPVGPCGCEGERAAAEEAARREEEERARVAEARLLRAGIGRRFLRAEIGEARAARFAASLGKPGGGGLYVHGRTGSGKTYLASAVARAGVEAGLRVSMTTAVDMFSAIQETYGGGGSTEATIRRYAACDLLVLDDLGKESASQWSAMTLYRVVNARYEAMLPTVFTSQYAPRSLLARLSRSGEAETAEAIVSRIRETCATVTLSGPDRRATVGFP